MFAAGIEPGTYAVRVDVLTTRPTSFYTHAVYKIGIHTVVNMIFSSILVTETAMELEQKPECS